MGIAPSPVSEFYHMAARPDGFNAAVEELGANEEIDGESLRNHKERDEHRVPKPDVYHHGAVSF